MDVSSVQLICSCNLVLGVETGYDNIGIMSKILKNKPSFYLGSCDGWHATTKLLTISLNILETFFEPLKKGLYTFSESPWKHL